MTNPEKTNADLLVLQIKQKLESEFQSFKIETSFMDFVVYREDLSNVVSKIDEIRKKLMLESTL